MRYPWLGIPFVAPRPERATHNGSRPARAADHRPRAMLAAPALALTAWLGLITIAIVDEGPSRGERTAAASRDAAVEGPSARPGRAGPGIAESPPQR
jgi:hypothetical protein